MIPRRRQRPPSASRPQALRVAVAALAASTALLTATAPSALGAVPSAQQVIAELNAQRAAHGIPAGVVEDPAASDGCRKHLAYLAANNTTGHDEIPGRPGYTPEGDRAGNSSVLSTGPGGAWGSQAYRNPYELAPLHLMGVLNPSLASSGVANDERLGNCMGIFSRGAQLPVRLFTYPGPNTQAWRSEETARESPFVPGDFVGLPQGTTTGPHLYAMVAGAQVSGKASMTLVGPNGPEEIRTVDRTTPTVGPYLAPGAIGVPVRPLQPSSVYTATATVDVGGTPVSTTWSFGTAAPAPVLESGAGSGSGSASGSTGSSGTSRCTGRSKSKMTRRTLARTGVRVCPSKSGRLRFRLTLDKRTARRARLRRTLSRGTLTIGRGDSVQMKLTRATRKRLRGRSFTLRVSVNRGTVTPKRIRVRG